MLLRGREQFELARSFITANKLNSAVVNQLLTDLLIAHFTKQKSAQEEADWDNWDDDDFTHFANLGADPAALGKLLMDVVASGRQSSDSAAEVCSCRLPS